MQVHAVMASWIGVGSILAVACLTAQGVGDEPSPAVVSAGGVPTSQPGQPSISSPTSQPAEAVAEKPWPPGLLMQGLDLLHARKPLDDLGLSIWGFAESSFTGDLTNGQKMLFGRLYDARRPNEFNLNQLQLTIERDYDNTKDFDLGGRVDGMFGGDPRLTHAAGLLDDSGGQGDSWTDVVQAYGQAWFKTGKDSGLELTFGKFLEVAGCESAEAVYNPLFSHSYLDAFGQPTTHTGVMAKYIFNPRVAGYVGVIEGWDVFQDNNDAPSYIAGGTWASSEQVGSHARNQLALNVITGPEQPHHDSRFRTLIDSTLTHYWTDKFSTALNGDFATERAVPGFGDSDWYGLAHYATYTFNDQASATWRTEWFNDDTGSRIGRAGNYLENTLGLNLTPCPSNALLKNLCLRPEFRWDHSDQAVFGGEHDQLTLAIDLIFKF